MILQLVNWTTTKSPSKLKGFLLFVLSLVILNLEKPLKLRQEIIFKEEKALQPMPNSPKL
jgi:hypothetical protein